jgi:tetratricopeptide (TPR) repeat protein
MSSFNTGTATAGDSELEAQQNLAEALFQKGNFTGCIDEAYKALSIHANDPDMQQLIASAQMQIRLLQSYGDAIKNAQDSFNSHDYSNALVWAMAALQKEPNNITATRIEQSAQSILNDYHTAVAAARAAISNGDYAAAETEADKALAIFNHDTTMLELKAAAETKVGAHAPVTPPEKDFGNTNLLNRISAAPPVSEQTTNSPSHP